MAQRSVIEETFRAIAPSRRLRVTATPTLAASFNSQGGDTNASLSQAGQEIGQLREIWQQQAALIVANTNAIQSNTGAQGSRPTGSAAGHAASSIFGGALGLLSPVAKGILGLFGSGGNSAPAPLPLYWPPPPISIAGVTHAPHADSSASRQATAAQPAANTSAAPLAAPASQITVNINAMDSQSFLDRSNDIASAVRLAMLNLHPINDVVADL